MLAQYRLDQHFDNKKQFKNMYVAVLYSKIKWEKQQDNKLGSTNWFFDMRIFEKDCVSWRDYGFLIQNLSSDCL